MKIARNANIFKAARLDTTSAAMPESRDPGGKVSLGLGRDGAPWPGMMNAHQMSKRLDKMSTRIDNRFLASRYVNSN
jgi:hypothetical protein